MNFYNIKYKVWDTFQDLSDLLKYSVLHDPVPPMPELPSSLKLRGHKDNDFIWVEAVDYPGFIASGRTEVELREAIFDTMLRYFNVPRYVAKRIPDQFKLTMGDGRIIEPPIKIKSFQAYLIPA